MTQELTVRWQDFLSPSTPLGKGNDFYTLHTLYFEVFGLDSVEAETIDSDTTPSSWVPFHKQSL